MSHREQIIKAARKKVRLAFIYAADGAFMSASVILLEVAATMQAESERINQAIEACIEKG